MGNHYENIRNANGLDLFPAKDFRLIAEENRVVPGGNSEIPVIIDMKADFAKTLSFPTPWDHELYGFLKCKASLYGKTGYDNTVKITLSEWDDRFTAIFEDKKGKEEPIYSIEKSDVKELLENCRKPDKL